jgi:tetratricopeptide (TPR) repeat protein
MIACCRRFAYSGAMTASVGAIRIGLLLLAGFVLSGCLPSTPREEEKEPHFLAGRSRVNTMDFKGAIESFEKALEVNPRSALAHFELGWLFDQKEPDPAAAIYHYESYLKLCPNSGKEEMVKTRILACKQQLAQAVSLAPGMEKQQRELEQLAEENRRLRDDLEKLRAQGLRTQTPSNTIVAPPAARLTPVNAAGQPGPDSVRVPTATGSGRSSTTTASPRTHTVKAGETPSLIARKYGLKLDALMAANPKLDPRRMQVGHTVVIP